jgi:hypothetical protein
MKTITDTQRNREKTLAVTVCREVNVLEGMECAIVV